MQSGTRPLSIIPILLVTIVLTQILYIVKSTYKIEIPSSAVWSLEAVAFLAIAVLALVAMLQKGALALAWAAIAMGSLLNVLQVGMGLTMFAPLSDAGEALVPVYEAVVAAAFYLYFAGKILFGFAAVVAGMTLLRNTGSARVAGALAAVAGLAAIVVNLGGIVVGMPWLYAAGATGTLATLLLALALRMCGRDLAHSPDGLRVTFTQTDYQSPPVAP